MVDVYNSMMRSDDKIKIIVLPNSEVGKDIYDYAIQMIGEEIE